MNKLDFLSNLSGGSDISSNSNFVCALDFQSNKLLQFSVPNNQPSAEGLAAKIILILEDVKFKTVIFALESTSFYELHIANLLSSSSLLMPYNPYFYCLNPKMIHNYGKFLIGLSKTYPLDAFVIADL